MNKTQRAGMLLLILPFVALVFVFNYLPLFGWSYAFVDYSPGVPLMEQHFVGFKYFRIIFEGGNDFAIVMRNTLVMSLLGLLTSPLPMIFAIALAEVRGKWLSKWIQTVTAIPHFISWVLVYAIFFTFFSLEDGVVNKLLIDMGLIETGTNILGSDGYAWFFQLMVATWKGTGWGAIIYLAAIAGIDQELYQAADIDGAGRFQKIWYITVPSLMPTYFVLLLLAISGILSNGFEQYYVFQNPLNIDKLEVLDTYIYTLGIARAEYAFSTAIGVFKSIVSIVLLLSANWLSKAIRKQSII